MIRRGSRTRWLNWLLLAGVLWALAGGTGNVRAHAVLERSDPPNNAVLAEPPTQVRMWFSEGVLARFSTARLLDINGQPVEGVSLVADSGDPRLLVVNLPPLGKGVYSLDWQVLSLADGHSNQGLLVFGIGTTPEDESGSGVQTAGAGAPPFLIAAGRVLTDVSLFALAGALLVSLALFASQTGADYQRVRRQAAVWALGLAGLAWLSGLVQLAAQQTTAGRPVDAAGIWAALTMTQWGQLWLFRQAMLLAAAVFLFAARPQLAQPGSRTAWGMGSLLAAAALAALALSSHAASLDAPWLPLLSTWLHYLAASLWVGGLMALAFILLPLLRRAPGSAEFARSIWGAFGRYAFAAVGLTLATGLFNTAGMVASSRALTTTFYGQALIRKVALVLLVGCFGLANSLALHPALSRPLGRLLRRPDGWRLLDPHHLPITVAVEALLGVLVLALAGVMASVTPANGIGFQYTGVHQYESLSKQVDDLLMTFSVRPNYPGQNQADVLAISTRKPPPAETLRVILRMTYLGKDLGTQSADAKEISPDLYRLGGSYFSLPGPWQVQVIVRRKGLLDSVGVFDWNVLPIGSGPNNFPLRVPLEWASGVLLVVGAGVTAWLFRRQRQSRRGQGRAAGALPVVEQPVEK